MEKKKKKRFTFDLPSRTENISRGRSRQSLHVLTPPKGSVGQAAGCETSLSCGAGLSKAARVAHLKAVVSMSFLHICGASSRDVIYVALPLYHMSASLLGIGGCIHLGKVSLGLGRTALRGGAAPHLRSFLGLRCHVCAEEEVLCQSVLERLREIQRDGRSVHRRALPVPGQPSNGESRSTGSSGGGGNLPLTRLVLRSRFT